MWVMISGTVNDTQSDGCKCRSNGSCEQWHGFMLFFAAHCYCAYIRVSLFICSKFSRIKAKGALSIDLLRLRQNWNDTEFASGTCALQSLHEWAEQIKAPRIDNRNAPSPFFGSALHSIVAAVNHGCANKFQAATNYELGESNRSCHVHKSRIMLARIQKSDIICLIMLNGRNAVRPD